MALKDQDPYVRKTAATCVAKLYDINPEECLEGGFLEQLRGLLGDANPMVVANSVASLVEIRAVAGSVCAFPVDKGTKSKLLAALGECTEWGQVYILNALALYKCEGERDAEDMCERDCSPPCSQQRFCRAERCQGDSAQLEQVQPGVPAQHAEEAGPASW